MGRERQKAKNRSSTSKVTRKPKSKKRILSNHIIASNWDKSQTLAQNYRRLGLTAKLNKNTGGVERKAGEDAPGHDPLSVEGRRKKAIEQIDVTEARIERDPKTGAILRIIDDKSNKKPNPLNDPLNSFDSESEDESMDGRDQHGADIYVRDRRSGRPRTEVVQQLEDEASRPAAKYQRKQPEGERAFVEDLVRKYGDDYASMARDMKINYMQRSAGDLKRRVKKWRESGGQI